jgi:hypothetical protein
MPEECGRRNTIRSTLRNSSGKDSQGHMKQFMYNEMFRMMAVVKVMSELELPYDQKTY